MKCHEIFSYCVDKIGCPNCCLAPSVVHTSKGAVRGSIIKSHENGYKVYSFRGIPYAKPPLGERRFRRSEPVDSWDDVLDGTMEAKQSLQPNALELHSSTHCPLDQFGGEDCLYLNVYTRCLADEREEKDCGLEACEVLEPVIVFLHGGVFALGSCEAALYGPDILLDRDNVVLVGVNSRLGALGFLSLECDEAPGNLGLHDQYLALRWIRENIASFGGDPDNVTLMGESSGAMSAICHLLSPLSRGLFHRVIAMSGTWTSVLMRNDRSPRMYAHAIARRLGYLGSLENNQELLKFLQKQHAPDILQASMMFLDWDHGFPMPWIPTVDAYAETSFLPQNFSDAVKDGNVSRVPVLVSLCQNEGNIATAALYHTSGSGPMLHGKCSSKKWELLTGDWLQWAPLLFLGREREFITDADREAVTDLANFYFGADTDMAQLERTHDNLRIMGCIYGMAFFYLGADMDSKLLAGAGLEVYNMMLCHPPEVSLMYIQRLTPLQILYEASMWQCCGSDPYHLPRTGVTHGDDLPYLFPMSPLPEEVVTEEQKKVRQLLLDIVTSFASRGRPTYTDPGDGLGKALPPLDQEAGIATYFKIHPAPVVVTNAAHCTSNASQCRSLKKEIEFWKQIHEKCGNDKWRPMEILPTVLHKDSACER